MDLLIAIVKAMRTKQGTLLGSILVLIVGLAMTTPIIAGLIHGGAKAPIASAILVILVIAWVIKVVHFAAENCKRSFKMKSILEVIIVILVIALLAVVFFSGKVSADSLELDRTGDATQIQICVERPVSGKVGAFAYSCQTQNWSETYAGLTYAPRPEIQVAFGAGQETGGNRLGGWIWAGKGRFSGLYCLEDGKTGTWDKLVLKYQVTNKLSLGYTKKMYAGNGVYVEYKLDENIKVAYSGYKTPELAIKVSF